ncbi:MAG TPA: hypothetical protein VLH09_01610, partial [Bryobacteraceae bacterium]|nr:hypothetical protein [Bryobacteraceae bacterium]
MKRAWNAVYWTVPSLLCLAIYWFGLKTWFYQDDFAWLYLNRSLRGGGDFWTILFGPQAQGTIRPLSERAFFMLFEGIFGLNALPFRITVFVTQFANLALVCAIGGRLSRSHAAGLLAAVLWAANSTLATVMSWTSAYNQVLCAFFILLSFWCLLQYIETGRKLYSVCQWVSFLMGFGALEMNVVYPALAACYTFLAARKHFLGTLWLLVPSAVYTAVHWHFAPSPASGPYRMYLDFSMAATLWEYWQWALSPVRLEKAGIVLPAWLLLSATVLLTVALVGFAVVHFLRGRRAFLFCLLWFLILIAPVLPLRDHLSDYYLTMPTIGLAMLGGWALADSWKCKWNRKLAAVFLAAIYLGCSVPAARAASRWHYNRSMATKNLILGLARAAELHPGQRIILTGLSSELFWSAIVDKAYLFVGINQVYLAPGSEEGIEAYEGLARVSDHVLPEALTLKALEDGWAVVYSVEEGRLRNVTSTYLRGARVRFADRRQPLRVDVGSPLFADQLGQTWYPVEGAFRWMPKRATVILRGPDSPGAQLHLSGFCPAQQVQAKPLGVAVSVDGIIVGRAALSQPDAVFDLSFPLPARTVGAAQMEVAIEVERT